MDEECLIRLTRTYIPISWNWHVRGHGGHGSHGVHAAQRGWSPSASQRVTRSKSRMTAFVFPEVVEQQSDDDSGPEGSFTESDAAEAPAVHTKKAGSKGTSSTADQRSGRTSTSSAGVAGNPRFLWDASEDHSPPAAVPRQTPKSVESSNLRHGVEPN
jgi:hypothetical protein